MASLYSVLNPTINCLLKSPAHRILSWRVMSVEYRGRRTGKAYATPVSYLREDHTVYCFTNGVWWHNFSEPRAVTVRIRGQRLAGTAVAAPAREEANVRTMARYFAAVPADAKFYGVSYSASGEPELDSVRRAAQGMVMIQIDLD